MPSLNTGNAILSNAITVDGSYRVGIGITPSAWSGFNTLQVGALGLWSTSANNSHFSSNLYYDGTDRRYISSDYALEYNQQSGIHKWLYAASGTAGAVATLNEAMRINASGQVSLNTTSAGYNSPVLLVNSFSGTCVPLQGVADSSGRLIRFYNSDFNNSNTGTDVRMGFTAGSGNTSFNIQVYTAGESASGNLILQPSYGNVGIGTSSPAALLHVNGGTYIDVSGGNNLVLRKGTGQGALVWGGTNASEAVFLQEGISGGGMAFYTSSGTLSSPAWSERMRITSGGNVLIGSSNESTYGKLQVTGVIWINFGNYLYTNSRYNGAAAGQLLINNGTGENLSLNETASNRYAFGAGSNGVAITRNVFEMDMSTGACFMKQYGNGTMSISGGQIATSSDKNLKIDDGGIDNALNKVLQLNPRYFYWKEESGIETTERQLGFYAQDVNEALGIEVANDNGNGKWGIYDRALIAMLTKSIQELSAKVTAQQQQINQLINK